MSLSLSVLTGKVRVMTPPSKVGMETRCHTTPGSAKCHCPMCVVHISILGAQPVAWNSQWARMGPPVRARKVRASVCQRVQARAIPPTGGTEKPAWEAHSPHSPNFRLS